MNCRCGGEVVYDPDVRGFVCTGCGLVVDDRPMVPDVPLAKSINELHERARYSAYLTFRMHDYGVGTKISGDFVDHVRSGRRWVVRHFDLAIGRDRKMFEVMKKINEFGSVLRLPAPVIETAGLIARRYLSQCERTWKNLRVYVPIVSIYIALKLHDHPASLSDMIDALGVNAPARALWRIYQDVVFTLNIKINTQLHADGYINKIARLLGVSPETVALSLRILNAVGGVGGRKPASVAAGSIYIASIINGERVHLARFKRIGISEASVRNGFRFILSRTSIEVLL